MSQIKPKMKGFHIERYETVTTTDEKGNTTSKREKRIFNCRRNACIPDDHKMLY